MTRTSFDSRVLQLGTLEEFALLAAPNVPFAVLVATEAASPSRRELALIEVLACSNCREMCFAGPTAERLHDLADEVVERRGLLEIVTTWLTTETASEVAFYFVSVAGGTPPLLFALVEHQPALASAVLEAIGS